MRLVFHHSGKYTGTRFTVEEVIASLSAQKEIIKAGLSFISETDHNASIDKIELLIENIETSSLIWDILVEIYAAYQKQIGNEVVGGIEGMFGVDVPEAYEPLVSLAAVAVTYMVARYAYERVSRSDRTPPKEPPVHISGEGNVVIQTIAGVVNQSPEAIQSALDRAVPPSKQKALIGKVADFLRPAKKEDGEHIEIEGAPPISAGALREFPSDAELAAVDDSRNIDVEGAQLDIRAMDRDKSKTGVNGGAKSGHAAG